MAKEKARTGLADSLIGWGIDRLAYAQRRLKAQLDSEDRQLTSNFLMASTPGDPFAKMADDEKRRFAMNVSWIYADIRLFANAFSGADLQVFRREDERTTPIRNHPFEVLLNNPNDQMASDFLWQYTIKWMQLRGNGWWYLAPSIGDPNTIVEIWPVPANRIKPLVKPEGIWRYEYTRISGQPIRIKPQYIVHFQFPNPFSLLDGEIPLSAALLSMETEVGMAQNQRDTYISGRGMPRSILSLPDDTSERDFQAISAQIREDFEEEQKVIIARAGDIKATTLGLNNRDMQLLGQREFTRDELDVVFLGYAIHAAKGENELRQAYRMFMDTIIHPSHKLIAGQVTVQVLKRYYENDTVAQFEDVRAQDRALNVQERNVYWRVKKFDEARADLNLQPIGDKEIGDLPVPLATDPAYVAMLKGISRTGLGPGDKTGIDPKSERRRPSPTAAMSDSDAPVNQLADTAKAADEGIRVELKRWEKVALREVRDGRNPGLYSFKSDVLPPGVVNAMRGELLLSRDVKSVFETAKVSDVRGGGRGRRTKQIQAVNGYQTDLEDEYDDWADETAKRLNEAENETERRAVIAAAALLLLASLQELGRKNIPDAMYLGLGDEPPTPELLRAMADAVASNENYLTTSLIPDIRAKIEKALQDSDIILAFQSGQGEEVTRAVLATVRARVGQYAGAYWSTYNLAIGALAQIEGKPIFWRLDFLSQHCADCLQYGDKEYKSMSDMLIETSGKFPSSGVICDGRCRCELQVV